MKNLGLMAVLIALNVPGLAQQGARRGTTGKRAAAAPLAENELKSIEKELLDAMASGNTVKVERILGEDYIATYPDGSVHDKKQALDDLKKAAPVMAAQKVTFSTDDLRVRTYGTSGVITGQLIAAGSGSASHSTRFTELFVKRRGRWQAVAFEETEIKPNMTTNNPSAEITTPSGLKYVDLVVGSGESPKPGQTVVVNYLGTFLDGHKFDSSYDRGQPFQFEIGMGHVIKGWDEGVMSMKVGGKRKLIIPYELAYGERGHPPAIPPRSVLVFEVELLGIQ